MRAYEIIAGSTGIDGLRRVDRPEPQTAAGQILVRLRAASLNFRDLAIARGQYFGGSLKQNTVPLSDGAGEVVAIGAGVTRFRVGNRVAGTFFRDWICGQPLPGPRIALGAPPADGVLAEYALFSEQDAVAIPPRLSFEAASTLPCAGVTAWHALMEIGRVQPGHTVLVRGHNGGAGNTNNVRVSRWAESLGSIGGNSITPDTEIVFPVDNLCNIFAVGTAGDGLIITVQQQRIG